MEMVCILTRHFSFLWATQSIPWQTVGLLSHRLNFILNEGSWTVKDSTYKLNVRAYDDKNEWIGVLLTLAHPMMIRHLLDDILKQNSDMKFSNSNSQMPQHIHMHVMVREVVLSTWVMLLVLELKMLLWIVHTMHITPDIAVIMRMQVSRARVSMNSLL